MTREELLKVNEPRVHKITKSLGVYDAYKWIRKRKWEDVGRRLTEHEFYSIIRKVNDLLAINLINGEDIKLPHRMGTLELRKKSSRVYLKNGKLCTNLPIDWDKTLKLWCEDEDAYTNRVLIRMEENEIFKVYYNKNKAEYNNKSFYQFKINRELKKALKRNIKKNRVDAFLLNRKYYELE